MHRTLSLLGLDGGRDVDAMVLRLSVLVRLNGEITPLSFFFCLTTSVEQREQCRQ